MTAWNAQSILLIWFTHASNSVKASVVFESVFGHEAETTQTNRAPNPAAPFLSVAAGTEQGVQFQVMVLPGRVDISVASVPEAPDADTEIADTAGLLSKLVDGAIAVSGTIADVYRQAIVLNLQQRASDLVVALASLEVNIDGVEFDDALDVSVQINKRKAVETLPDVSMNRLMRVSTAVAQQISVTMGNGLPSVPVNVGEEVAFSVMAIDLNTVPTGRIFSPDEQSSIWKEFAQEALRLRSVGNLKALNS